MIGEERALIQAPTKRQRKWNQERDKGNGTNMGCYFFKYFYFISRYALVSSFCLVFYRFIAKISRSWSEGTPTAERKRQRKLSGYRPTMLHVYAVIFTIIFAVFHFTH